MNFRRSTSRKTILPEEARWRLSQFFSGYFHQDWAIDDANVDEVVHRFCCCESGSAIQALTEDLKALLGADLADDALAALILSDFGCDYDPMDEAIPIRLWLEKLYGQVRGSGRAIVTPE
jgi:hypothetical protein